MKPIKDPSSEGPFANGCFHEMADQVTMTIEHDRALHSRMVTLFRMADSAIASRTRVTPPRDWTADQVASFHLSAARDALAAEGSLLLRQGLKQLLLTLDPENVKEAGRQFDRLEVHEDALDWLFRRYLAWRQAGRPTVASSAIIS